MSNRSRACPVRSAAAAQAEAKRMIGAVAEAAADATVRMSVAQFRVLAHLLAEVAEAASGCGGSDCLGARVDGVRFWVTQDRLDLERAEKDHALARARSLAARLAELRVVGSIAPDDTSRTSDTIIFDLD